MGQRKLWREWHSTMIMAQTSLRRPVAGSGISPNRPKSASATSPGGVSSIRTVVLPGLSQLRFRTKRRSVE